MRSYALPLVFVVSASCVIDEVDDDQLEILGGETETGYSAVGAIKHGTDIVCTGTLISENTVLTAAHCLYGRVPSSLRFVTGVSAFAPDRSYAAACGRMHPAYVGMAGEDDIAILKLRKNAYETPMTVSPWDMTPYWVDNIDLAAVGYGVNEEPHVDDSEEMGETAWRGQGTKRSRLVRVLELLPKEFRLTQSQCKLDSGGPVVLRLWDFWITGVATDKADRTDDVPPGEHICFQAKSLRTDQYRDWIDDHVFTCSFGTADCDCDPSNGCEASLTTNSNCGECGRSCGPWQTCNIEQRCVPLGGGYHPK